MAEKKINAKAEDWFWNWGRSWRSLSAILPCEDRVFEVGGTEYKGFIVMTALFIPLLMLSTGLLWWLTGKLSKMQVATLVLVIIFGGLSVWLNDERFFKMKPTMIYLLFGGILGVGPSARAILSAIGDGRGACRCGPRDG